MTSTVALLIVVVVVLTLAAAIAVLSFRRAADAIRAVNESHARNQEYTKDLLDRLMAMDFNTYKAYTALQAEEGDSYIPPDEGYDVPVQGTDRGGFGSRLGLRAMGDISGEELDELAGS